MTTNTNAALRSAAKSALEALEALNGVDTETESVTIHVSDEIAALRAALAAAAQPQEWPQASVADKAIGWTLDYKFLEKVEELSKTRTEYSTSMEATEQVLIAAMEVLAAAPTTQAAPQPAAQQEPVALPFAIFHDEMDALRRFDECVRDGQGYDVPKAMMRRLSEIGLVRRITANVYEHTDFGCSVLNGDFNSATSDHPQQEAPVAQGDAWRDLLWQIADALECTPCAADEVLPKVQAIAEDAARLDWLDKACAGAIRLDDRAGLVPRYAYWGATQEAQSARAAIDAARSQAKEGA